MSESLEDANDKNSWVFVESKNSDEEDLASKSKSIIETASNVENVKDTGDSDTDSISVISESGCSCKTDEEDVQETKSGETAGDESQEIVESPLRDLILESPRSLILKERFFHIGTSTICVFAIIGLGIAVQHYLTSGSEELDGFYYEDLPRSAFSVDKDASGTKSKPFAENYEKKDKSNNYKINEYKEKRRKRHETENYQLKYEKSLKDKNKLHVQGKSESYEEKIEILKIKEDYLTKKEKFLIEKEHDLMKQEMQFNTEKVYDKASHFAETKEHKRNHKQEQKLSSKDERNRFSEKSKHFELKPKSTKNDKTKKEKFRQNDFHDKRQKQLKMKKTEDVASKYQNNLKKRNVTGDWFINLHKARLNIREKEKASDWVFDRAYIRNLKRNKAHWYFQWMVDRGRLRVKQ